MRDFIAIILVFAVQAHASLVPGIPSRPQFPAPRSLLPVRQSLFTVSSPLVPSSRSSSLSFAHGEHHSQSFSAAVHGEPMQKQAVLEQLVTELSEIAGAQNVYARAARLESAALGMLLGGQAFGVSTIIAIAVITRELVAAAEAAYSAGQMSRTNALERLNRRNKAAARRNEATLAAQRVLGIAGTTTDTLSRTSAITLKAAQVAIGMVETAVEEADALELAAAKTRALAERTYAGAVAAAPERRAAILSQTVQAAVRGARTALQDPYSDSDRSPDEALQVAEAKIREAQDKIKEIVEAAAAEGADTTAKPRLSASRLRR